MALAAASTVAVEIIPLDRIQANGNLRESLPDIPQLAESIREHGMLTAILVDRRADGDYELVAGFRRHAAAIMAGLDVVPAVVRDPGEERERVASQVAENVQRLDLTDLEQAQAMQQLLDLGATAEDVARVVGATSEAVEAWTAVLRLPRKARVLVADGTVTMTDAVRLTAVADSKQDLAAALTDIGRGHAVSATVDRIVQRREIEAKRTAAVARLEAEGCTLIDAPSWDHFPVGSRIQRLGKGRRDAVDVSVAKHRKLACHAAFVDRQGDVVYVCTDRRAHETKTRTDVPDRKAELALARAAKKALREAHAVRLEALTTALRNGAFATTESLRHVLTVALWGADARELESACGLLEVAVPEGVDQHRHLRAILGYVGEDIDRLVTICLAVAIATAERHLTADRPQYQHTHVATLHGAFIAATGLYDLTDAERTLIAERGLSRWDDRRGLVPGADVQAVDEGTETPTE